MDEADSCMGFPGDSVVKNLPANAGDMGSVPDLGRLDMPRSNKAHEPQPLSLCSRAWELQLLSLRAVTADARAPQSPCSAAGGATVTRAHTLQLERSPRLLHLEKGLCSSEDPAQP